MGKEYKSGSKRTLQNADWKVASGRVNNCPREGKFIELIGRPARLASLWVTSLSGPLSQLSSLLRRSLSASHAPQPHRAASGAMVARYPSPIAPRARGEAAASGSSVCSPTTSDAAFVLSHAPSPRSVRQLVPAKQTQVGRDWSFAHSSNSLVRRHAELHHPANRIICSSAARMPRLER